MSEPLFSQSLTLSQIAPGPNILLVAVMGWNIGTQHAAPIAQGVPVVLVGLFTAGLLLLCTVIPSSLLTFTMSTWLQKHQHALGVRAFKTGMLPLVTGLMLSTGWLLESASNPIMDWRLMVMCGISTLLVLFTRIHLLWLMLVG
ncbi:MAG: chromate transporter, partial [Betaproteobacteria bacterium]|nr:chromate transporter [Betaproteobacteria bacterium]